jgi:hypothetical protein
MWMRRTALTVVTALVWIVALATPASAHTVSGVGATNWRTALTSVTPPTPGLVVKVVELGSRLELTNHGPEVVVLGYNDEPYLRVGPQGVFRNALSPATYLNCSRQGCPVSPDANPQAPPQWQQISSAQTVRWHDHRIHWMGTQAPPVVRQAPGKVHQLAPWNVVLHQGTQVITVTGTLTWLPGPSALPWLGLAAGLLVLGLAIGALGLWGAPLALLTLLLTVNDAYHALGIGFSAAGGTGARFGRFFAGSFYSIVGWLLGLLAAWLLTRRRIDGLYAAAFAGISAALFGGLLDITVLSRSQAPFAASVGVDRFTVAVSLGLGLGVALGAIIALRREPPPFDDDDEGEAEDSELGAAPAAP